MPSCGDQATRASKSTFLGLCEGLPSDSAGVRRRHFEIANNSLHEVIGAVDLADTIGAVDGNVAEELLGLAVRLKRVVRGWLGDDASVAARRSAPPPNATLQSAESSSP